MALLGTLQVRMGLDTATFSQRFTRFTGDLQRRTSRFARGLQGLTSFGSIAGSAGLGLGLKSLVGIAADFESQMQGVRAIMSGLSDQEFAELTARAKQLGATTRFTAREAAAGIEMLGRNGLKASEILGGALDGTLALAAATGSDLPLAADLATDAMRIFNRDASELGKMVDQISGTTQNSKFDIEAYQLALAAGGAAVVKAGRDFEDFNAVIAGTSSFFASGETAGTAFKVFIDKLVNDSKAAKAAQEKLGISFFDAAGKLKDFGTIAEDLKTGLAGLTDQEAITSLVDQFGTRGANFAVAMARAGKAGIDQARSMIVQANAADQAKTRLQGLSGQLTLLKSATEGFALSLAEGGLLTALTSLAEKATAFVGKLSALPQWVKTTGLAFAGAAVLIPPFAFVLSQIALAAPALLTGLGGLVSFLAGPWGLAIAGAVAAVVIFRDDIVGAFRSVQAWFANWISENQPLIDQMIVAFRGLAGVGLELGKAFLDGLTEVGQAFLTAFGSDKAATADTFMQVLVASLQVGAEILTEFAAFLKVHIPQAVTVFKTAIGIVTTVVKTLWSVIGEIIEGWKKFIKVIQDSVQAVKDLIAGARSAAEIIPEMFNRISDLAKTPLRAINSAIDTATSTLQRFGIIGKKVTAEAVEQSWLTDLAVKGAHHMGTLTGAIQETEGAMKSFSTNGRTFADAFQNEFRGIAAPAGIANARDQEFGVLRGAEKMRQTWSSVLQNMDRAVDDFVSGGKIKFKDLINSIISDFASSQLKNAIRAAFSGIAGLVRGDSGVSVGSVFSGVVSALASFEGGGFTGRGPRVGGVDGRGGFLSVIHPDERVIDYKRGGKWKGEGPNISIPITLMPGVSREELATIIPQLKRELLRTIPEAIALGGAYGESYANA